jgi:hypothetical protein
MSRDYHATEFIGRLAADPETKYADSNGDHVVSLTAQYNPILKISGRRPALNSASQAEGECPSRSEDLAAERPSTKTLFLIIGKKSGLWFELQSTGGLRLQPRDRLPERIPSRFPVGLTLIPRDHQITSKRPKSYLCFRLYDFVIQCHADAWLCRWHETPIT